MGRMDGGQGKEDRGQRDGAPSQPPHGVFSLRILSLSLLVQIKARGDGLGIRGRWEYGWLHCTLGLSCS